MNADNSELNAQARELNETDLAAAAGGFVATDDLWRKKGFLLDVLSAKPTSPSPGSSNTGSSAK